MCDKVVYSELFHITCRLQVLCPTRASRQNSPNLYKDSRYASCFFVIFLAGPSEFPSYICSSLAFAVSKILSTHCDMPRYRRSRYNDPNGGRNNSLPHAEVDEFDHPNNTLDSPSMAITRTQRRGFQSSRDQFCSSGYQHQSRHRQRTTENQTADPYVSNPSYRNIRDSRSQRYHSRDFNSSCCFGEECRILI